MLNTGTTLNWEVNVLGFGGGSPVTIEVFDYDLPADIDKGYTFTRNGVRYRVDVAINGGDWRPSCEVYKA